MKEKNLIFTFGTDNDTQKGIKQISITATLQMVSSTRAIQALETASQDEDLFNLANQAFNDGEAETLFDFLNKTVSDNLEDDKKQIENATEDELKRALESRRSSRSKIKSKGLTSSKQNAIDYLTAGYSELMIRSALGKSYNASSIKLSNFDDPDVIKRRIKSLQSKKCHLNQLVKAGDTSSEVELNNVIEEIESLQSQLPNSNHRQTKKVTLDELAKALSMVDKTNLDGEALEALQKQLAELRK